MTRCLVDSASGDCLTCGAAVFNGEACRRPLTIEGAKRKNRAYERARADWRRTHPLGPVEVSETRRIP